MPRRRAVLTAPPREATVSHHLKKLMDAGILASKRRDGMNVWYRLNPEALADVSRILDPGCC